jgi:anti-sigma28 factor (negative regulator of flagellin synthesis)
MQIYSNPPIDSNPVDAARAAVKTGGIGKTSPGKGHAVHGDTDQVQLSELAQQFAAGTDSKVNDLAAVMDSGTYSVSPNEIAKSIMAEAMTGPHRVE